MFNYWKQNVGISSFESVNIAKIDDVTSNYYFLFNFRYVQNKVTHPTIFKCMVENYCSHSDSDDEKKKRKPGLSKQEQKVKSDEALKKLNVLLKQMIEDNAHTSSKPALNLAKPKPRPSNNKKEADTISSSSEQVGKLMFDFHIK